MQLVSSPLTMELALKDSMFPGPSLTQWQVNQIKTVKVPIFSPLLGSFLQLKGFSSVQSALCNKSIHFYFFLRERERERERARERERERGVPLEGWAPHSCAKAEWTDGHLAWLNEEPGSASRPAAVCLVTQCDRLASRPGKNTTNDFSVNPGGGNDLTR